MRKDRVSRSSKAEDASTTHLGGSSRAVQQVRVIAANNECNNEETQDVQHEDAHKDAPCRLGDVLPWIFGFCGRGVKGWQVHRSEPTYQQPPLLRSLYLRRHKQRSRECTAAEKWSQYELRVRDGARDAPKSLRNAHSLLRRDTLRMDLVLSSSESLDALPLVQHLSRCICRR